MLLVSSTQSPDVVECMSDFRCKPFWVLEEDLHVTLILGIKETMDLLIIC